MGKSRFIRGVKYVLLLIEVGFLVACRPEMPVISSITVQADGLSVPVNPDLYGITLEEINHGIDGGLYAELMQNRSFEDGVPPLNCPYDAARNRLITPSGWSIPFLRPDSIPGWQPLARNTQLWLDTKELINDKNRRSLLVAVSASSATGRGGVCGEGYRGIALRKGERYRLSFFTKAASMGRSVRVALEDSSLAKPLSDVWELTPAAEWQRFHHIFTATADAPNARLTFSADTSIIFWLDVVSLFPERTWQERPNGARPDLAALIDSLAPRFIRFPGGSFAEGYTAGTYPIWRETIGAISERKHFWNVWGYGTTNGMGYHEYLQFCEDVGAEPVYVINSGVTSQSRRPRYEDITAMGKLVDDALAAIAYANAPVDSAQGAMRARNGHTEPFHLRYVEIGSENYGSDYAKRFVLFRDAIRARYPEITVISSSDVAKRGRSGWVDSHFYSLGSYFFSGATHFDADNYSRRAPMAFIGEFSTTEPGLAGTLRAAVAEACFLVGAESNPDVVRRLAYAPLLGNAGFESQRVPLITFDTYRVAPSPSYHLLRLFSSHRGDELLPTRVDTYRKPQVSVGRAGIEMFDNSFEFKETRFDGKPIDSLSVVSGGWRLKVPGEPVPDPNRWNRVLFGDSTRYAYEYTTMIRRVKGSGQIQLRLRDNGLSGEAADYVCMTIGSGGSELYHQAGGVKESLVPPAELPFASNRWYTLRLVCENEHIRCYVDGKLLHEAEMRPIPSLVCVATIDKEKRLLYLKVVNTTWHEEKTSLNIEGVSVRDEAEVIELAGDPAARNTLDDPGRVRPVTRRVTFPLGGPMVYSFPPGSVTLLKLRVD